MARITKKQISEKDPFGEVGRSALSAKENVLLLENSIKMLGSVAKNVRGSMKGLTPKNSASIKKINEQTAKANTIAKERENIQRKLNVANSTAIQKNVELNEQLKLQRKTNIQLAKDKLGLISAYSKESKRLIDLRNQYKNLAVQEKQNTKVGRALLKNITQLDAKLKKIDATVGQNQRNVGNYGAALGRLKNSFGRLAGALGIVGGFMLFRRVLTSTFNIVKDFEQANADLASVLASATVPELTKLSDLQKKLGSTTIFTASQVAELQKEFAKLGFPVSDIENMTEATLSLAAATGTELAEAASVAGGILNGFGLSSSSTQVVVDVMAKSFSKSALDMEKFKESMKTAVPIARATGIGLEQTTAAAGVLANNMISGSKAGTDLKKIFSELVKDGLPLEESLENIAKQMDEVSTPAEKLAIAEDLVKDRAKGALLILVEQREELKLLQGELENSEGAAKAMADTQIDTLGGAVKLLTSAWEGWVLRMNDATRGGQFLTRGIKFMARNLNGLFRILKVVIAAFAGWKLGKFAVTIGQSAKGIFTMVRGLRSMKIATMGATAAQRSLNTAQKSSPWGLIISLVTTAIALIWDYATATDAATIAADRLNVALDNEGKLITARNIRLDDQLSDIDKESKRKIAQARALGKTEAEVAKIIEESLDLQKAKIKETIGIAAERISQLSTIQTFEGGDGAIGGFGKPLDLGLGVQSTSAFGPLEVAELGLEDIDRIKLIIDENVKGLGQHSATLLRAEVENLAALQRQLGNVTTDAITAATVGTGAGGKKTISTRLKELKLLLKKNRFEVEKLADENTKSSDVRVVALNTEGRLYQSQIKAIEKLISLDLEKAKATKKGDLERIAMLGAEFEAQKKLIAVDPNVRGQNDIFIDEAKITRDLEIEKAKIRLGFLKDELKLKEALLMENFDTESVLFEESQALRLERITLENKIRTEEFKETQEQIFKDEADLESQFLDRKLNGRLANAEEIAKAEIEMLDNIAAIELDLKLSESELSESDFIKKTKKSEEAIADERRKFNKVRVGRKKETDAEILEAENQLNRDLILLHIKRLRNRQILLKKESLEYKELTKEIFELQQEADEIGEADIEKIEEDNLALRQNAITHFTDFFIAQSDKRIDKINEEIAAAERQANLLAGLAESGNITARESLAEQDRIIADANRRKAEEEKRKQRILLVSSVLEAYNNELANDVPSGQAFAKAVTSTAILTQFIGALPTFFDGIEDTGSHGQGVDGRGGFTAVLHPNERVITAKQNAKMGGISNEDAASIIEQYRFGAYMNIKPSSGGYDSNEDLKQELALVRKAIEDKPEQVIELGQISQTAMTIRETTRKGNRVTTNTFRVN